MSPVEWPIDARSDDRGPAVTRRVNRDRLSTIRDDFFLSPDERLTEQERALMTAMLADLVAVISDEIAAALGRARPANDRETGLFERLFEAGLLDLPPLLSVLLRRAEEERLAASLRSSGSASGRRLLHSLAAHEDADAAAAAMALILARSRRRDRFDQPRLDLDDVAAEAAVPLAYAVAAAMACESNHQDLCDAAAAVLSAHDEGRRMEALGFALVHALDSAGQLDEQLMRSALGEGEVAILVEALARRAGIEFDTAWAHFVAGGKELAKLLRLAGIDRPFAAELAACVGETSADGAAMIIGSFDSFSDAQIEQARGHWRVHPAYRDALAALGGSDGHSAG